MMSRWMSSIVLNVSSVTPAFCPLVLLATQKCAAMVFLLPRLFVPLTDRGRAVLRSRPTHHSGLGGRMPA
jgi:hypothetical protein